MIISRFPSRSIWSEIARRPMQDSAALEEIVRPIIEEIRKNGDRALRQYTREFDGVELNNIRATDYEIAASLNM